MKKSNNKSNVALIIFLFILGLLILLYPTISNRWNEARAKKLMVTYDEVIARTDTKDIDLALKAAIEYNKSLIGMKVPDAFAFEEANKPNEEYERLLNLAGDGYMCSVEIPVINVNLPVYHYTSEEVLQKGVGHLPGSSLPVGGLSSHTVLSAHRGLPSAKLFTDLDRIKENDIFYIHVLNEILAYEVDLIKVIEPSETDDLAITENKDYATLFTCTPYAVNSHRLLVRGHRIEYNEAQYLAESNKTADVNTNMLIMRIVCVVLGIQLAFAIIYISRQLEKRKRNKGDRK